MDSQDRSLEGSDTEVSRLFGLMDQRFGSFVTDFNGIADLLVGEGYELKAPEPSQGDTVRCYSKGDLSVSLSMARKLDFEQDTVRLGESFVVFKANGERYMAHLPLYITYKLN